MTMRTYDGHVDQYAGLADDEDTGWGRRR